MSMSTRKSFPSFRRLLASPLTGFALAFVIFGCPPVEAQAPPPQPVNAGSPPVAVPPVSAAPNVLAGIKSWAYQLQNADSSEIARSPYDLVVIDHTKNGDPKRMLRPGELARMKKKPDGSRRIVLAYVSIGEAEDYRFYWDDNWVEIATPDVPDATTPPAPGAAGGPAANTAGGALSQATPGKAASGSEAAAGAAKPARADRWVSPTAPAWLGDESEIWSGNFAVKYWDKGWQDLIVGSPGAFVERVLALGFDGVYLDRVDAYYEHIDEHPSAAEDMIDFVVRLAEAARKAKPGAFVVPQNGEELLTRPRYVAAIDAIAKEDLLYGSPTESEPNSQLQINNSLGWLKNATDAGRAVMVVEYLDKPPVIELVRTDLAVRGFIPYFGPRALDTLSRPWAVEALARPGPTGTGNEAKPTAASTDAIAAPQPGKPSAEPAKERSAASGSNKKKNGKPKQ